MTPRFFGYGSLVNTATHDYPNARPSTINGWRRTWRHTAARPVAYLTATPDPNAQIDGLCADVPDADWHALDLREAAYVRVPLRDGSMIYHIPDDQQRAPTVQHPILLSYLDVVVQGYVRVFGEDGVARFFETTDGWDAPVQDDRADPLYPRAQALTASETALVDDWLRQIREGA